MRAFLERASARYSALTTPRASNLPNLVVLLWFPVLVLIVMIVLVALGISGSSTGAFWPLFDSGPDPSLLAGQPRSIRGDEWWVQSQWVISQYSQGFPVNNQSFPGGMSSLLYNDSPSWHWSMIFRPHAGAMLFLPLDQGMAVRWWLPLAGTLAASYTAVVALLPRRAITAALLAIAVSFSPIIMWWFLPSNVWPVGWGFTVLACVVFCLKARRLRTRLIPAAITGYLTVTTVMGLYAPYIVAVLVPTFLVALGMLFGRLPGVPRGILLRLKRLIPLAVAGVLAGVVIAVWLYKNRTAVSALLGTVYPGNRVTGSGVSTLRQLVDLFSSPFQTSLQSQTVFLSNNQSEASAPIVLSAFLCVPLIWLIVHQLRRGRRFDVLAASVVVGNAVIFAWMYVPGINWLGTVLLLNRTTTPRIWMSFVILTLAAIVVLYLRLEELTVRVPWWVLALTGVLLIGATFGVWRYMLVNASVDVQAARNWPWLVVLELVALLAVLRRWILPTAVAFLAFTLIISGGVNPLYRGVFDLRQTDAGRSIAQIKADHPHATWVDLGGFIPMTMLFEEGVRVYGGVQTYPSPMWNDIDPTGQYKDVWNRLAHVQWQPGTGEPVPVSPRPDKIMVSFDSCSAFAQQHVTYALDDKPVTQKCLTLVDTIKQGKTTLNIYRVVKQK